MLNQPVVHTLDTSKMEAALANTIDLLKGFYVGLDGHEKNEFKDILNAAKSHTDDVQARNEGDLEKTVYDKPVQVHTSTAMKEMMKSMPKTFANL